MSGTVSTKLASFWPSLPDAEFARLLEHVDQIGPGAADRDHAGAGGLRLQQERREIAGRS